MAVVTKVSFSKAKPNGELAAEAALEGDLVLECIEIVTSKLNEGYAQSMQKQKAVPSRV